MMIKDFLKRSLQKILGFDNYLFLFSLYSINRTRWDKEFVYFMKRIPADGAILDIGANIGIMSVTLAKRFKTTPLYSFEPMPNNLTALKKVIRYYNLKNIVISEIALGEQNGELKIVTPVIRNIKMQGLTHVVTSDRYSESYNEGIVFNVPVKKLDDIDLIKNLPKISAIKIDVENYEYEVLKGGENILRAHKPIIYCELWPGEQRVRTIQYLTGLGFKTEVFDGNGFIRYDGQESTNFVFSNAG
jgi:FkbM family methyltransferase